MQPVFRLYGLVLIGLGLLMLLPMTVELYEHTKDWEVYAVSIVVTLFIGGVLYLANQGKKEISRQYIFLFTTTVWLVLPVFAALPFVLTPSGYHLDITDAVFESISGLTTTGSTVMTGLDHAPHGILLWRSLLEWIGGVGIIVMAMAILPQLGVGGMQLFRSESSDTSDKILPRARQVAVATFGIYAFLTFLCGLAYYLAGMEGFDAINHAMTTMSTGGFSTHDASMAYFDDPVIESVGSMFMLLGGIPLLLYFSLFMGKKPNAILLSQARVYVLFCVLVTAVFAAWLSNQEIYEFWPGLIHAAFTVISVITTTGYVSADYTLWGTGIVAIIYFLTIIGGCTGSTSGGMKIFRFQVMALSLKKDCQQVITPHGVFSTSLAGNRISTEAESSVKTFFLLFALTFSVITIALSLLGLDFVTSMSAAGTAIANVGPGLGDVIGPTGNFSTLPDAAKWVLGLGMVVGRLEILTVIVVLSPYFWEEI